MGRFRIVDGRDAIRRCYVNARVEVINNQRGSIRLLQCFIVVVDSERFSFHPYNGDLIVAPRALAGLNYRGEDATFVAVCNATGV